MTKNTESQPIVGGHVMCDTCNQPHPAEYSHEGRFGEGPVYIVMCGELADYYLTERVIVPEHTPKSKRGNARRSTCTRCGENISRSAVSGWGSCAGTVTAEGLGLKLS